MGENKKHTRVPRCVGKEVSLLIKLVEKAINGDEESFRCLVQQRKEAVYKIAYSYVNNPDDALDIVQEAVYRAFVSVQNLKHPEYFNTWLTRITINCAVDFLKQKNRLIYLDKEETLVEPSIGCSQEEKLDLEAALNYVEKRGLNDTPEAIVDNN